MSFIIENSLPNFSPHSLLGSSPGSPSGLGSPPHLLSYKGGMYFLSYIIIYPIRLLKETLGSNFSWFFHYILTWEDVKGMKNDKHTRKVLLPDISTEGQVLGKWTTSSDSLWFC